MKWYCECDDMACVEAVELSIERAEEIAVSKEYLFVIVDSCKTGASPNMEVAEECEGYKLYVIKEVAEDE